MDEQLTASGKPAFGDIEHVPTKLVAQLERNDSSHAAVHHEIGWVQLTDGEGHVRKIPTPTTSPADPLNWSKTRKWVYVVITGLFASFALGNASNFGTIFPSLIAVYAPPPQAVPISRLSTLITYPNLLNGVGNFLFVPMGIAWGRRPAFLAGAIMFIFANLGAALSNSFSAHQIARVFIGFAGGATETLVPIAVTDVSFISERDGFLGLNNAAQGVVSLVMGIAAGYVNADLSWRWYYWLYMILGIVTLVMVFLFAPESRFTRPGTYVDGQIVISDAFGNLQVLSDEEGEKYAATHALQQEPVEGDAEKSWSAAKQLNPFPKPPKGAVKLLGTVYLNMARSLLDPVCVWAIGLGGAALAVYVCMTLSIATILQQNYGWPARSIGLYTISPSIGTMLVWPIGLLGDRIQVWLANRNNGLHRPEHHLPLMALGAVSATVSSVVYGQLAQHTDRYHWMGLLVMVGTTVFGFVLIIIISVTYIAEHSGRRAGAALVLVVGGKNFLSYAISNSMSVKIAEGKYLFMQGIVAAVLAGWSFLAIPLYYYAPRYRVWRETQSWL